MQASNGSSGAPSLGILVLKSRCLFTNPDWYWIGIGAVIGFTLLFHGIYNLALAYFNGDSSATDSSITNHFELNSPVMMLLESFRIREISRRLFV